MKNILKIGLLAVVALFALSACDGILEWLFPDDTGDSFGNNSWVITVEMGSGDIPWWAYEVIVEVENQDDGTWVVQRQWAYSYDGYAPATATFWFDGLKDGNYVARAWMDEVNGNTAWDLGEPYADDFFMHLSEGQTREDMLYLYYD